MDVKPKGLLRRLVDLAVSEIERRSRAPQNALPSEPFAPAQTTPQGRANAPDSSAQSAPSVLADASEPRPEPPNAPAKLENNEANDTSSDDLIALDVTWRSPNEAFVRWALTREDVENARALGHELAGLTLRTVAFHAGKAGVSREVSDHPIADLRGELVLSRLRERRMIVSVGLLRDDTFCSIAHVETR